MLCQASNTFRALKGRDEELRRGRYLSGACSMLAELRAPAEALRVSVVVVVVVRVVVRVVEVWGEMGTVVSMCVACALCLPTSSCGGLYIAMFVRRCNC
jgi:hypothetical protein